MRSRDDLVALKELIEAGKLTPVVSASYPLSEVPEAVRHFEEGPATGTVVITVRRAQQVAAAQAHPDCASPPAEYERLDSPPGSVEATQGSFHAPPR